MQYSQGCTPHLVMIDMRASICILIRFSAILAASCGDLCCPPRETDISYPRAGQCHVTAHCSQHGWFLAVMFKNLPRQAFGKIQAKLFPKYFLVSVLTLALQIGTLKFAMPVGLQREQLTSLGERVFLHLSNRPA